MDIIELAKRRGFFWQSSLLHGGMTGLYDYGHIGTLLKQKWETAWRRFFLSLGDHFYEISPSLLMPEQVFRSSGHLQHFVDPVVECGKCKIAQRADQLLEETLKERFEGKSPEELMGIITKHKIRCPVCKGTFLPAKTMTMMFPVEVGVGKEARTAYLTPETAQGAYLNFKLEWEALRKRLPFGLAIVGKAFRNEISPRNALLRMREFTQAELQVFFDPETIEEHPDFKSIAGRTLRILEAGKKKERDIAVRQLAKRLPKFYLYHLAKMHEFYTQELQVPKTRIRLRELSDEEKAFYNQYHWDVEVKLSVGWKEIAGCHYRGGYDLLGHQKGSGEKMVINIEGKQILPHVCELSFGVDRNVFALLELFQVEEKERSVLKLPRVVSPIDVAVFPLVNKDGLPELARQVRDTLRQAGFSVSFDTSGSIGRMYRRMDEIGTAACLTVDYDSKKRKDVTLRDRDTMKQVRVKITDVPAVLTLFLAGEPLQKLGKLLH